MASETDPADILIERANASDAEALSALGKKTFADTFGHLYSAENLKAFLDSDHAVEAYRALLVDEEYRVWKAIAPTGEMIGYCVAGKCGLEVENQPDDAMEIKRLYVGQNAQSFGLGRRLMDIMMAWIDKDGRKPVFLSVYKYNDGAQRFYGRYGFSWYQDTTFLIGDHVDPELIFARLD